MAEQSSLVTGAAEIAVQFSLVVGAAEIAVQSSSAVVGAAEIAVQSSLVAGGGGILVQDSTVLGGGGITEHVTAVLGGGGMAEPDSIPLCCVRAARQARANVAPARLALVKSGSWNHVPFGQECLLKVFVVVVRAVPADGAGDEQQSRPQERHPEPGQG